jgi:hypothetical protein
LEEFEEWSEPERRTYAFKKKGDSKGWNLAHILKGNLAWMIKSWEWKAWNGKVEVDIRMGIRATELERRKALKAHSQRLKNKEVGPQIEK